MVELCSAMPRVADTVRRAGDTGSPDSGEIWGMQLGIDFYPHLVLSRVAFVMGGVLERTYVFIFVYIDFCAAGR